MTPRHVSCGAIEVVLQLRLVQVLEHVTRHLANGRIATFGDIILSGGANRLPFLLSISPH
jgi:hypothetical protein